MKELSTRDPLAHAENIHDAMSELVAHLRRDVEKVDDPRAQALFAAAADVIDGLRAAFERYESAAEAAMTPGPV